MKTEIAIRLAHIFRHDFKRARFQAACISLYPELHGFKNKAAERRYDRKCVLFDVTKELYIECRDVLGLKRNEPLPINTLP